MDPVRNPYRPGAGNPPPLLAGRDYELEQFRVAAQRPGKSVVLMGLRGVGKTVLLNAFLSIATDLGYPTIKIEATATSSLRSQLERKIAVTALRMSAGLRAKKRVKEALRVVRAFQVTLGPDGVVIGLGDIVPAAGSADSGVLADDLVAAMSALGDIAEYNDERVVIAIDELQVPPSEELAGLIMALHEASQRSLPIVFTGAGLATLPGRLGDAVTYAERIFNYVTLDRLDPGSAREALVTPARAEGVEWEPAALDRALLLADNYAYFLQEIGSHCWDAAWSEVITAEDVDAAETTFWEQLDASLFQTRLQRVSDAEKQYMKVMAELGCPAKSGDVAKKHPSGRASNHPHKAVAAFRQGLIDKGMIYSPNRGEVDFTVPGMTGYFQRHPHA